MRLIGWLIAGVISISSFASLGTESATATMFCYSLRCQRALDPDGNYYLDLSSSSGGVNGELALDFFQSGYTHSAYLRLVDELFGETLSGAMALDVPNGGDANGDGFFDFFQVSQGVANASSSGAFQNLGAYGNGSITATWNRNAGSKDGICVLSMKLLPFQPVRFSLPFELIEYKGQLSYTPGSTNVSGSLTLVQTGNSDIFLNGPIEFVKVPEDRTNELMLQPAIWTNESQQAMSYTNTADVFSRDAGWPTNYYGNLVFYDLNDPSGFYPYGLWLLSIDDTNDSNHNGIPDFSDDPVSGVLPRAPELEIVQSTTNLLMTLHGDVGHLHEIQELSGLGLTNWQTKISVTLTNDPQSVSLPLPAAMATFWRVRAR